MRSLLSGLTASLLLSLASPLGAQTVHVVDANGGLGSSYTTIGAAVAAAADGDLVLVRRGNYTETVTLDGKGLNLQAETGASVRVRGITVRNLAPSQHAAFRGIGRGGLGTPQMTITLEHDRGQVWIEDLDLPTDLLFADVTATITDCDTVVLRNCNFKPINPDPAVEISTSTVALYQCTLVGQDAMSSPFPIGGTAGLSMATSNATLYACTVKGGKGSEPLFGGMPGPGGPGCAISSNCVLDVIDSSVQGGPGGTGGVQGLAYATSSGSVVHVLPGLAHTLTTPSPVREGTSTSLTLHGHPGDRALLIIGLAPGLYLTSPTRVGPLVIGTPRFNLSMGVLPASGTQVVNFNMPLIAGQTSSFYLQGLFLRAGEIALGTPTQVHVLDASF